MDECGPGHDLCIEITAAETMSWSRTEFFGEQKWERKKRLNCCGIFIAIFVLKRGFYCLFGGPDVE